jgi:hypothetical protein
MAALGLDPGTRTPIVMNTLLADLAGVVDVSAVATVAAEIRGVDRSIRLAKECRAMLDATGGEL